jgi:hypothetical protein
MAVTDLTDSLPWWARGGAGGPGPTGGPEGTPQGAGGLPGGGPAWLQYLSQMYGIDPSQAMAMLQSGGGNPANMPSPNAQNVNMVDLSNAANSPTNNGFTIPGHGDGPPPPPPPVVGMNNFGNPPAANGPGPGNVGPVNLNAANVGQPPAPSAGPPVGAGMLDQSGVQRGPMGVLRTQPGASAPVGAGLLDQSGVTRNPAGVLSPGAPATPTGTGPASPVAAPAARVPGPMAGGGAGGNTATSNPRFVGIERPNADPTARRGSPQGTALNLAGLFGRGQGAVNPNAPAANSQPVSGPLAPGGISNAPLPPVMPPDIWKKRTGLPNY